MLVDQAVSHLQGFVSHVPKRPADPDRVIVAEVPPDLTDDHRDRIGREFHVMAEVEVVYGLHKTDAPYLEQVVYVFTAVVESL